MAKSNRKTKSVKLRAFQIANRSFTQSSSGIIELLHSVLSEQSIASERRMRLNQFDADEDLLGGFDWLPSNHLFGTMFRVIPGENSGEIPPKLFSQNKISAADIEMANGASYHCKELFYFLLSDDYLVTNLSGQSNITGLQTYMNWLLKSVRNEKFFDFSPVVTLPKNIPISHIRTIEYNGANIRGGIEEATKIKALSKSVLDWLFGEEMDDINDIIREQLISAKLVLRIKRKPKEMMQAEFLRCLSAMTKEITSDSGITIQTKDNRKLTGGEIKETKNILIEKTSTNNLSEEQLRQEMEVFLCDVSKRI